MKAEKIEWERNREHDEEQYVCVVEYVDQQSVSTATNALIEHKLAHYHHYHHHHHFG